MVRVRTPVGSLYLSTVVIIKARGSGSKEQRNKRATCQKSIINRVLKERQRREGRLGSG